MNALSSPLVVTVALQMGCGFLLIVGLLILAARGAPQGSLDSRRFGSPH